MTKRTNSQKRPAGTCGCTFLAWGHTQRPKRSPSWSKAKAATSTTSEASATWTDSQASSPHNSAMVALTSLMREPSKPRRLSSSHSGPMPIQQPSTSPRNSRPLHRETSTESSSRLVVVKLSKVPGSWRANITVSTETTAATK